jgi:dynamin 1-like protein
LAVSDGSIDIANSVSIKLAKEVDPTQDRTIGVVTKVDLAPNDLTTLLSGKTVPMKLGMVGVINRSQDDINNDITIDEVLEREEDFFKRKYPALHKTQGSQYLAKRLNEILMRHIKKSCPDLDVSLLSPMHYHFIMYEDFYHHFFTKPQYFRFR